jgi:hypothetical protein
LQSTLAGWAKCASNLEIDLRLKQVFIYFYIEQLKFFGAEPRVYSKRRRHAHTQKGGGTGLNTRALARSPAVLGKAAPVPGTGPSLDHLAVPTGEINGILNRVKLIYMALFRKMPTTSFPDVRDHLWPFFHLAKHSCQS